jgi:hypothetical protein
MSNASEITRILSAIITFGKKVINLTESDHKAILQALMVLVGSAPNHSDAESSGKVVLEFLADVKESDLDKYTFEITDNVKVMVATGTQIRMLATAYSVGIPTEWKVNRGGSRAGSERKVVKLNELS